MYPASEGFIAYTDSQTEEGLLLCVSHGIFYEFIPSECYFEKEQKRISLEDVEIGVNYVIILNTDAGLWGYNIGDTVRFVSVSPYRIVVTGRIKHFTSAFGEHVIAEEVERSITKTLASCPAKINEFHVAPMISPKKGLPFHEWFIEFDQVPVSLRQFSEELDVSLQEQNVYYKDLILDKVLQPLKISIIKKGGFRDYMRSVGKLGGQNKVPRLSNNRSVAEKLKNFEQKK